MVRNRGFSSTGHTWALILDVEWALRQKLEQLVTAWFRVVSENSNGFQRLFAKGMGRRCPFVRGLFSSTWTWSSLPVQR